MTLAPVGTLFQEAGASSFSLTPAAVGHFVLVEAIGIASSGEVTALSSANATWTQVVAPTAVTTAYGTGFATVFLGKVTAASAATVTLTGTALADVFLAGQEFSTTAGLSALTFDVSGLVDTTTAQKNLPALTPGHGAGELYWAYIFSDNTATAGTTAGYTWQLDSNGNIMAYNAACTAAAQAPAQGTADGMHGLAVMMYEASTSVTGAGSLGMPSLALSGAGAVAVAGAGSLGMPSLALSGAGAVAVTGAGSLGMPSLAIAGAGGVGARTLLVSIAARAGTDDYGNGYPPGLQVKQGIITGSTIMGSVFEGTNWVEDSDGQFMYSGPPALGNMLLSIAPNGGTDSWGNTFFAGFWAYIGTARVGLYNQAGNPALMFEPGGTHQTIPPQVFSFLSNPGLANENLWLVLSSGKSGNDDAAVQLVGAAADGTAQARIIFEFGGTTAATLTPAGFTPAGWTSAALGAGWAASGSGVNGFFFRTRLDGQVEWLADVKTTSATPGATVATIPAGYVPSFGIESTGLVAAGVAYAVAMQNTGTAQLSTTAASGTRFAGSGFYDPAF